MNIYNEINHLVTNDLENYNKRTLTNKYITKERLQTVQAYTDMWAKDEANRNLALALSHDLDVKLYEHIKIVANDCVGVTISDYFIDKLNHLATIDEALTREESLSLGLSNEAYKLRKTWRKELKKLHKNLNLCCKNHINFVKEHRKPRQAYMLKATGEIHNGLYWTFRTLLTNPKYIKCGFKKEN